MSVPLQFKFSRRSVPFNDIDWRKEVETELNGGREVYALFLIHGFIEAYLRDWLLIIGNRPKPLSKQISEDTDRITFKNLLLIHSALGTLNHVLYQKIDELNKIRNLVAHDLITINYKDKKTSDKTVKYVKNGLECCGEVHKLYKNAIDAKAKIVKQQPIDSTAPK